MPNYKIYIERYSIIRLRQTIVKALREYSYSELARASGIARSTIYKIVDGTFSDVNLSTAQKIMIGIVKLKYHKSLDNL